MILEVHGKLKIYHLESFTLLDNLKLLDRQVYLFTHLKIDIGDVMKKNIECG